MLWRDDLEKNEKLLFHGAKSEITGEIDIYRGRSNNDFGQGFYTGESYEQAISFVSGFEHSSVQLCSHNLWTVLQAFLLLDVPCIHLAPPDSRQSSSSIPGPLYISYISDSCH